MNVNPIQKTERIITLDVIRGFAILGIFIMNIQSMSMISAAYFNPTAYGDFTGINRIVWIFSHIFADSKFMTIFSILFGAGVVLFTDNLAKKGISSLALHYRRTFWLLLFGLIHAYFLWYGDILVTYALCSFWIVFFRHRKARTLFLVGFLLFSIGSAISILSGISLDFSTMPANDKASLLHSWSPTLSDIQQELAIYRGSFFGQLLPRIRQAFELQTFVFIFQLGWKAAGLMLIGMGLYKSAVLTGQKSNRFYIQLSIFAYISGYTLIIIGLYQNFAHNFSLEYSFFLGSQFNYWACLPVALGYIALFILLVKFFSQGWLITSLQAVGQTALSNYLLQSMIASFLFYGHGLGLFGKLERWQQFLIVMAVWVLQLVISPIWLKFFKYGPFEWLWRSLTYWQRQPLKK